MRLSLLSLTRFPKTMTHPHPEPDTTARRLQCAKEARCWLEEMPYFLDSETTGTGDYDEICEIAVLGPQGTHMLTELVQPSRPIPASATDVHGISDEDVSDAPSFEALEPELMELLQVDAPTVIYNADFDARLIRQSASHEWLLEWPPTSHDVRCAMRLMARWHGDWSWRHRSYSWISQERAAHELGLDLDSIETDLHRARADAELCRRIVHEIAAYC